MPTGFGTINLETLVQKIPITGGDILLIGKNQVGTLSKTPLPGANYATMVTSDQVHKPNYRIV